MEGEEEELELKAEQEALEDDMDELLAECENLKAQIGMRVKEAPGLS
jgi:hypothetical protein